MTNGFFFERYHRKIKMVQNPMKQVKAVAREAPMSAYLGTKMILRPILINPKRTAEIDARPKAPFLI